MYRPAWFDAAVQYQPSEPPKAERSNLRPIEYAEDRLLAVLAKKHPELWTDTIINLVPDAQGHVNYTHPATVFVNRQKHWIAQGQTEEEAYHSVLEDWKRQKRFERIELQVAMAQAAERGVEVQVSTPWEERQKTRFQEALTRRLNLEQQKRRERLEALLEARDADGETEPVDLGQLDPDISQSDLDGLLEKDERAQAHFGGDGSSFSLDIERLLPRPGDPEFESFRQFVDANLGPQEREKLLANLPDTRRAQYFPALDEQVEARLQEQRASARLSSSVEESEPVAAAPAAASSKSKKKPVGKKAPKAKQARKKQ